METTNPKAQPQEPAWPLRNKKEASVTEAD